MTLLLTSVFEYHCPIQLNFIQNSINQLTNIAILNKAIHRLVVTKNDIMAF